MSLEFDALRRFLESQMRMSHIYQPLMLRTILQGGGTATTRQIAAAFLAEDESQLEYYEANYEPDAWEGAAQARRCGAERRPLQSCSQRGGPLAL